MATCNTNTLLSSGVQFLMAGGGVSQVLRVELLRRILLSKNPTADTSVNTLMNNGRCFTCLTAGEMRMVKVQLLCEIFGGGSSSSGCVCTSPILAGNVAGSSAPYTVNLSWTFLHGLCDIAQIEVWKSTNGAAFTLLASVVSTQTTYSDVNAGADADTVRYEVRYVNATTTCPFSNIVSFLLNPS